MSNSRPRFFRDAGVFRKWLEQHHHLKTEQWVGYYKKHTGKSSIVWPESVDIALCFGWIDGLRKSIDADTYMIRFTPRKSSSHWSKVNIRRFKEMQKQGLVTAVGRLAYSKRNLKNIGRASHEQSGATLLPAYTAEFKRNQKAWQYFQELAPSRVKSSAWWVMSAKQETTRLRRLAKLIECSESGELVPPLVWTVKRRV